MWRAVKGDSDLEAKLHALLHPGPVLRKSGDIAAWNETSNDGRQSDRHNKRRHDESGSRDSEATSIVSALLTRKRLIRFSGISTTWGRRSHGSRIPGLGWGSDRWDLLEAEFGHEVAEAARDGLMAFWRLFEPPLRSERDTTLCHVALLQD